MNFSGSAKTVCVGATLLVLVSHAACGQPEIVKSEGITSAVHRANVGRIVFIAKPGSTDSLSAADFLRTYELRGTGDLSMKAFMRTSLTNYLHELAPELSADQLARNGNYQISFFVDGALVYKENIHPGMIAAETKNKKTIFTATIISPEDPDDPWGTLWHFFLLEGGAQALTPGKHLLKVELRPYLQTRELKVGNLIAAGDVQLTVTKPPIDEKSIAVQPIASGSGWRLSGDSFDKGKIRQLNRLIAEGVYEKITSIVVIKNGELLLEEYFNGANRTTLHNTRSVAKSVASAIMGIAINDGYIKSENQTLKDFYDLKRFANYSAKKDSVTIKSLLTMSSGFDGNDDDDSSPGNEAKMYPTADWIRFALDVPMDDNLRIGETWHYFTAGVVLLGDIINKSVPGGLERYADEKLFRPLGITTYKWPYTPQKVPSTAGGLSMSALDFAKFGQLYENHGQWNGRQIVPRAWVDTSLSKRIKRGPGNDEYYGSLWWYGTLTSNGKPHEVFFATGNGGSKIFLFRDQPLVIVITATAYNTSFMHRQATSMMERYILPAVIN